MRGVTVFGLEIEGLTLWKFAINMDSFDSHRVCLLMATLRAMGLLMEDPNLAFSATSLSTDEGCCASSVPTKVAELQRRGARVFTHFPDLIRWQERAHHQEHEPLWVCLQISPHFRIPRISSLSKP